MTRKKIIALSIIGAILLIIIGISIYIYVMTHKKVVKFSGETEETSTYKEITSDTLDIESNDPKDVLYYSLWRVANTKEFMVSTTGTSKALGYTVDIKNERIVKNNEAMLTTVYGGLLKNCTQHYFNNKNVYIRETNKISKSLDPTFKSDTPTKYTKKEYINLYGWMAYEPYGYIFNDNTLEELTITKNNDNTYTLHIDLNMNSKAVYYYKREIAYNSNSVTVPDFHSVNLNMTVDSNYYIKEVKIKESYSVSPKAMAFLGEVKTTTSLTDTFTYDNIEFNSDYYNYFKENIN